MRRIFVFLWAVCFSAAARADALSDFLSKTRSADGEFTQRVYDKGAEVSSQRASGRFSFSRPGRFIWKVESPDELMMVSNGDRLWIYDSGLEQVTVSSLSKRASSGVVGLLFGSQGQHDFISKALPSSGKTERFLIAPKNADDGFKQAEILFENGKVKELVLQDAFGFESHYLFTDVRTNIRMDLEQFEFKIPAGADVVGE